MPEREGRVVAIDGPAASGKSTTAHRVAERLGFHHLNSGLLYRAVAWVAERRGWDEAAPDFGRRVRDLEIRLVGEHPDVRVRVDGQEPGPALHSPEVAARVSSVAARGPVRARVLRILRESARDRDLVVDGRDIGTVVFPDADLKVFLTCDVEERARRRLLDYGSEPSDGRIRKEAARLRDRDVADSERELSPLRRAEDAVEVDTTHVSPEAVVERILELARERGIVEPAPG